MYVHGMLHRIEGDIDNTRAWYGDVKETEVFKSVWGDEGVDEDDVRNEKEGEEIPEIAKGGWKEFLNRLERYRDRSARRQKMRRKSKDGDDGKDHADTSSTSSGTSASTSQTRPQITDWSAEESALSATSLWEMLQVLRFCERKFGTGVVEDAKSEFLGRIETGDAEQAKMAQAMVTGGEGWRTF